MNYTIYEDWLTGSQGLRRLLNGQFEPDVTQLLRIQFRGRTIDLDPNDVVSVIVLGVLDGVTTSKDRYYNHFIHELLSWNDILETDVFNMALLSIIEGDLEVAAQLIYDYGCIETCPCDGQEPDCELCFFLEVITSQEKEYSFQAILYQLNNITDLDISFNLN